MRFLAVLMLLLTNISFAQKIAVVGVLKDISNTALPSATVMILSAKDSALVNFTTTDALGRFVIKNLSPQLFLLKISYVGFTPLLQPFDATNVQASLDLGTLLLKPYSKELDEVTIIADRPPVVVKKDTIEFNADSFKTNQNASVEDLLKRLPGVEVASDGTIRAQGEQVQRMTVDGKNFFGSDPKIASKNLPADVVSKVQIYDKKSDQAAFSGIDDGQKEKTINLELKEEKRKGVFGNLMAGGGNNGRYSAKGSMNKFSKSRQVSVLAMGNNINQQGFGIDEYMNFSGGSQQLMSGGGQVRVEFSNENNNGVPLNFGSRNNGLMTTYAGGLNFNKDLNKKTEVNSSYFYNQLQHDLTADLQRINYFPDGSETLFYQNSIQQNTNYNHRGYAMVDYKLDSLNSIKFTTVAILNYTNMDEQSSSKTIIGSETLNTNNRSVSQQGSNTSVNSTLLWRHKFSKKGRNLSVNAQLVVGDSERQGNLTSVLEQSEGEHNVYQNSEQDINNVTYATTLSYTEPLGNRKYLEGNFTFRENINALEREVYDLDGGIEKPNFLLSTAYNSYYQYKRGGINFRVVRKKYNLLAGASLQHTSLNGVLKKQELEIQNSFQNVLPVVRFNYDFSATKHISLDVETNVQEPTIQQLQPIVDNSDPVNLYTGNPDLRPAYSTNLRMSYRGMSPVSFINFFAFTGITFTENPITISQTYTTDGIRILRPENVGASKRYFTDFSFGFPISKIGSRINLATSITNEQSFMMVNQIQNRTVQNTLGSRIRYDYQFKEIILMGLGFQSNRQFVQYSDEKNSSQLYFNNSLTFDGNITFLKNFTFNMTVEYLKYINKTLGVEQNIPLVDLSMSRYLLKGKNGELRFGVYNILDKNLGVSQSSNLNYFETQRYNNLGRYFMISFTYNLNKQINPMAASPRGKMVRVIR
jgi:hypothetical protein